MPPQNYKTCEKDGTTYNADMAECPMCHFGKPSGHNVFENQGRGGGPKPRKYLCPRCKNKDYVVRAGASRKAGKCKNCRKRIY